MAGAPPPPPGPKRQARLTFADDDEELVEFRPKTKRRGPGAKTIVARAGSAKQGRFMDAFFMRRGDDDADDEYAGVGVGAGAGAGAGAGWSREGESRVSRVVGDLSTCIPPVLLHYPPVTSLASPVSPARQPCLI